MILRFWGVRCAAIPRGRAKAAARGRAAYKIRMARTARRAVPTDKPRRSRNPEFSPPKPIQTLKMAIFKPFLVFLTSKRRRRAFGGRFGDHRESSSSKTSSRSIFLAKDAKGAKKHMRGPKPLGAPCRWRGKLGALCERNSSARLSGPAGSVLGSDVLRTSSDFHRKQIPSPALRIPSIFSRHSRIS